MLSKLKLNLEERKIVYEYCKHQLLILASEGKYPGICSVISRWIHEKFIKDGKVYAHQLLETFPELVQFEKNRSFWWPVNNEGLKSRIEALSKCIKEVEEKQDERSFNVGMLTIMLLALIVMLTIVTTIYIVLTR
jgi:hypothetical protein